MRCKIGKELTNLALNQKEYILFLHSLEVFTFLMMVLFLWHLQPPP